MGNNPTEQWWTINGAELLSSLYRAYEGEHPVMIYTDLVEDSQIETFRVADEFG